MPVVRRKLLKKVKNDGWSVRLNVAPRVLVTNCLSDAISVSAWDMVRRGLTKIMPVFGFKLLVNYNIDNFVCEYIP